MTHDSSHTKLRAFARLLALAVQIIAVCLVLADLVLISGVVERRLAPALSQQLLGARVHFRIDSWRPLHIRGVQVQQQEDAPLLKIDTLTVQYQFRPLHIDSLHIRGVQVHIDNSNPEHPNYAFLLPYLKGGDSRGNGVSIPSWLPERVEVFGIRLRADMPDYSVITSGLNGTAHIESLNRITASLTGDAVRAGWHTEQGWPDIPLPDGKVTAAVTLSPDILQAQAQIELPDFILLDGTATLETGNDMRLDLAMNTIQLDGPVFGTLASIYTPVHVAFDRAAIAPLQLKVTVKNNSPSIENALLDLQVEGLVLGEGDTPWYSGNLGIKVEGEHGHTSQATWEATLNQGQRISGTLNAEDSGIALTAHLQDWSGTQLAALWPGPYAHWKGYLPELKQMAGTLDCRITPHEADFSGNLSPVLPSGKTMGVAMTGNYNRAQGTSSMQVRTVLGKGPCTVDAALANDELTATITCENASVSDAFQLSPWPALSAIQADLTGKAIITQDADRQYVCNVEANAAAPGYNDWRSPESLGAVGISGRFAITPDFAAIAATGQCRLPDDSAVLNVTELRYDIGRSRFTTRFTGTAALASLGAAFGVDDLWGDATAEGSFTLQDWTQGEIAPMRLSFETLGYGDLSLPYGKTVIADAPLRFNVENLSLDMGPLLVTLDEGTKLSTETIRITQDGIAASSPIVVETNFAPLVAKQYLAAAEGMLILSVEDFQSQGTTFSGTANYQCTASRMALPDKLADIRGLTASGTVALHSGGDGTGTLQIDEILAAGVTVQKTIGTIRVSNNSLLLEDTTFNLFGGGVVARAEVRPFESGLPVVVSGEVRNIDLNVFTNEFEPPSLVLTGRVNGTFAAGISAQQLVMLEVDLEAHEQFSMNRDMVEQLLMRQYVGEMAGGRQMERMLASVIGKDEQRTFDRAVLKLGLEDKRITGYAKLESEALDLTVDIKADPLALLEALRARQQ